MVDNYIELANAIVLQAVKDYRKVLRKQTKHPYKKEYLYKMRSLEHFFRSQWYKVLTNIDGNMLIKKLKLEVQQ